LVQELRRLNATIDACPGPCVPEGFARRVRAAAEGKLAGTGRRPARRPAARVLSRLAVAAMVLFGAWFGASLGLSVARTNGVTVEVIGSAADELDMQLGLLSAAPSGSMAEVYLAAADGTEPDGGEQ